MSYFLWAVGILLLFLAVWIFYEIIRTEKKSEEEIQEPVKTEVPEEPKEPSVVIEDNLNKSET